MAVGIDLHQFLIGLSARCLPTIKHSRFDPPIVNVQVLILASVELVDPEVERFGTKYDVSLGLDVILKMLHSGCILFDLLKCNCFLQVQQLSHFVNYTLQLACYFEPLLVPVHPVLHLSFVT